MICESLGCTKPATTERVIGAPFSMSSTATDSKMVKKLCGDCDEAEKRAKLFSRQTLNTLK